MPQLTHDAVMELARACFFKEGEPQDDAIEVEGIVRTYGFRPGRIAESADVIGALLAELPNEFQKSGGGGWSFLNACTDRHGHQWTDLHQTMEMLFCLGIAAGKAKWLLPRDIWESLPGGMPYVAVWP